MNIQGEQVKVVPITPLVKAAATSLGLVTCCWTMILVQGEIFFTVERKDCLIIMVIVLFISFSLGINFFPDRYKFTWPYNYKTNRSMLATIQHLELPVSFIDGFSYWFKVISTIICAGLSMMRLVSQDFGKGENNQNTATRNFALNVFYVSALIETVLSLLALMLQKLFKQPKAEKKEERKEYKYCIPYIQQQDQSNNFQASRRKGSSVDQQKNVSKQKKRK